VITTDYNASVPWRPLECQRSAEGRENACYFPRWTQGHKPKSLRRRVLYPLSYGRAW